MGAVNPSDDGLGGIDELSWVDLWRAAAVLILRFRDVDEGVVVCITSCTSIAFGGSSTRQTIISHQP
jgi:hypothetical protein